MPYTLVEEPFQRATFTHPPPCGGGSRFADILLRIRGELHPAASLLVRSEETYMCRVCNGPAGVDVESDLPYSSHGTVAVVQHGTLAWCGFIIWVRIGLTGRRRVEDLDGDDTVQGGGAVVD